MLRSYFGEQIDPKPMGSIEVNTEHEFQKSPFLVMLKFFGLLALAAVGYPLLLPMIPLPLWKSVVLVSGIILVYVGLAFFIRPEPHKDNMGWLGGFVDDPFHYSDNVNRFLFTSHMLLGPGRFVAGTILDMAALCGLAHDPQAAESTEEEWIGDRTKERRTKY